MNFEQALLVAILGLIVAVVFIGLWILKARKRRVESQIEHPITGRLQEVPRPSADRLAEVAHPEIEQKKQEPIPPALSDAQRVDKGLGRTKAFFQQTLDRLFSNSQGEQFFNDMEEALLTADVGIDFAENVVTDLKKNYGLKLPERHELKKTLADILVSKLPQDADFEGLLLDASVDARPRVIMIVGVNGAGKTTTIAKLCQRYQSKSKKVLVGAADTFRAAATEQLKAWVERVGAEGVFQKEGSDPSAVAFDSVQAAQSRQADICIIDTAGRLHTKVNLMEELAKMKRVIGKAMPGAPHDVWLVVDGSTGQNALNQAREFHQHLGLSGVIVTKLDGSAKGGAVIAITAELKVPIMFIGVGESPEDLIPFHGKQFVETILEGL